MGSHDISGSLPPGIIGPLRGYIEIGFHQLIWFTSKPVYSAVVRLNWKNITGKIANVYQRSNCQDLSVGRQRVKYAVRCRAPELENYLKGADILTVKLLASKSGILLGRGRLKECIETLTSQGTIRKSLKVLNDTGEDVAQFSLEFKLEMLENPLVISGISKCIEKTKLKRIPLDTHRNSTTVKNKQTPVHSDRSKAVINVAEHSGKDFSITKSNSNDLMQVLEGKVSQLKSALSNLIEENIPNQLSSVKEDPKFYPKDKINECASVLSSLWENDYARKFPSANIDQEAVKFLLGNSLNEDEKKIISALSADYSSAEDDDFEYLSEDDEAVDIKETLDQLLFSSEVIKTETKLQTIQMKNENFKAKKKRDIEKNVGSSSHSKTASATKSESKIHNQYSNNVRVRLKTQNIKSPVSDAKRHHIKPFLLHCMLCVPCGCNFKFSTPRNFYLICRTFSKNDFCQSDVCWNTTDPKFDFKQIIPVLMTNELLDRLKNNFMVIEVWDKTKSQSTDELIGICKLPVHTIYQSFKDEELTKMLIKIKKPVVVIDGYLPVIKLTTTTTKLGDLEVYLALGTQEQLKHCVQSAPEKNLSQVKSPRPVSAGPNITKHKFTISSIKVKLQHHLGNVTCAETDCYVEYVFPKQNTCFISDDDLCVCYHKLKPRLFAPEVYFDDEIIHELYLPVKHSIRNILSKAYSGTGMSIFVYCRYYYPQEHDTLVAKTFLPIQQLTSIILVKMKNFKLNLYSIEKTADKFEQNKSGTVVGELQLNMQYEQANMESSNVPNILHGRHSQRESATAISEKLETSSSRDVDSKSVSIILKNLNLEDLEKLKIIIEKRLNSKSQTEVKIYDGRSAECVSVQSALSVSYKNTKENHTESQSQPPAHAMCVTRVKKKSSRIAAAIFK